ncbi:MAG TPA: hypothetical protein VKY74_13605 [Chloroflexia bacterium]|nr:hypothetical protein [Chloroflexia bacterium]
MANCPPTQNSKLKTRLYCLLPIRRVSNPKSKIQNPKSKIR